MSKAVIVNPGFIVRLPGQRFTEGQRVELDDHTARRFIANGTVREADEAALETAPAADAADAAPADAAPADNSQADEA